MPAIEYLMTETSIYIKDLRIHAYHGVLEQERRVGFMVSIKTVFVSMEVEYILFLPFMMIFVKPSRSDRFA